MARSASLVFIALFLQGSEKKQRRFFNGHCGLGRFQRTMWRTDLNCFVYVFTTTIKLITMHPWNCVCKYFKLYYDLFSTKRLRYE